MHPMNVEEVREYCLQKEQATEGFPFGDDSLVFKVLGKMFALLPLGESNRVALKCDPTRAVELRETYQGVEGAYHFNKTYWNSVYLDADVPSLLVKELIDHSYAEVVKKLPKKLQTQLKRE